MSLRSIASASPPYARDTTPERPRRAAPRRRAGGRAALLLATWFAAIGALALLGGCSADEGAPSTLDASATDAASTDASTSDGSASDAASTDAGPSDSGGPSTCGASTCGADQVCVHPCCGGAAPFCEPAADAGTCAPGATVGPCQSPSGGFDQGCRRDCTPPEPFCAPVPPACSGAPSCGCLPGNVCTVGTCTRVEGGDVTCVCA